MPGEVDVAWSPPSASDGIGMAPPAVAPVAPRPVAAWNDENAATEAPPSLEWLSAEPTDEVPAWAPPDGEPDPVWAPAAEVAESAEEGFAWGAPAAAEPVEETPAWEPPPAVETGWADAVRRPLRRAAHRRDPRDPQRRPARLRRRGAPTRMPSPTRMSATAGSRSRSAEPAPRAGAASTRPGHAAPDRVRGRAGRRARARVRAAGRVRGGAGVRARARVRAGAGVRAGARVRAAGRVRGGAAPAPEPVFEPAPAAHAPRPSSPPSRTPSSPASPPRPGSRPRPRWSWRSIPPRRRPPSPSPRGGTTSPRRRSRRRRPHRSPWTTPRTRAASPWAASRIQPGQQALGGVTFRVELHEAPSTWAVAGATGEYAAPGTLSLVLDGAINCAADGLEVVMDPGFAPDHAGLHGAGRRPGRRPVRRERELPGPLYARARGAPGDGGPRAAAPARPSPLLPWPAWRGVNGGRTWRVSERSRRSPRATASATSSGAGRSTPDDLNGGGRNRGRRLREMLDELGPTFVKFGQLLSTRPDIVPPDILARAARAAGRRPSRSPSTASAG